MNTKQKTSSESIKSPGSNFWEGFRQRSEEDTQGSTPLNRYISVAGPRLAELTELTDAGPANLI